MNVGSIVEIYMAMDNELRGMWKVDKVINVEENGGMLRQRAEASRGPKKIIIEEIPGEVGIAVFRLVETNNDRNLCIPPDPIITYGDDVTYATLDPSAGNPGFKARFGDQELTHWEYMDETSSKFFQVLYYKEPGVIDILLGEQVTNYKTY